MTSSVPLLDLKPQYEALKDDIQAALARVYATQRFIMGPEVLGLEQEIADYCNTEYSIGVSSGTDALLAALMVVGVGQGDEVITTPYTFFATAGCIARLGAKAVFVDIDPKTYNLNPAQIETKITPKTKAILPVHLYGQCADMDPIMEIAERHNLYVIEDAAQAIGSEYKGRRAGSIGHIGCFSFFPSKNLGAFGDGGIVTVSDTDLADRIRVFRAHGSKPKYYHKYVGGNFRLDAMQAAIVRVKLKHLDDWTAGRQQNAAFYNKAFTETGLVGQVLTLPHESSEIGQYTPRSEQNPYEGHRHIYNQYVLRVSHKRDALMAFLKEQNIGCEIYYPLSLHQQECFAEWGYQPGEFSESEAAANSTIAIPIYPELTEEQQQTVVQAFVAFYS